MPYPFAGAHQLENAKAFRDMGMAVFHEQNDSLIRALDAWLKDCFSNRVLEPNVKVKGMLEDNPSEKIADKLITMALRGLS